MHAFLLLKGSINADNCELPKEGPLSLLHLIAYDGF
jgi:hypothetical protein